MTGPVLVAALVLVWAGATKAWRPDGTARALGVAARSLAPGRRLAAGPPGPAPDGAGARARVRARAGAEIGTGVMATVGGGSFLVAMGCSYAAFAAFVAAARRWRWPLSSCGCFGVAGSRPTRAHLLADVALAAVSLAAAAEGLRPLSSLARHPADGAAAALLAVVVSGLLALVVGGRPVAVTA